MPWPSSDPTLLTLGFELVPFQSQAQCHKAQSHTLPFARRTEAAFKPPSLESRCSRAAHCAAIPPTAVQVIHEINAAYSGFQDFRIIVCFSCATQQPSRFLYPLPEFSSHMYTFSGCFCPQRHKNEANIPSQTYSTGSLTRCRGIRFNTASRTINNLT